MLIYISILSTRNSALDGFARLNDVKTTDPNSGKEKVVMQGITSRLNEIGHTACATTDHGSLSAVYPTYLAFEAVNKQREKHKDCTVACSSSCTVGLDLLKYLPGIEFYIVDDRKRPRGQMNNHLVCIARNEEGWRNLLRLNYESFRSGSTLVYDRVVPRIDMSILEKHTEGLLVASACLAGIPPQLLKNNEPEQCKDFVRKMKDMFTDKQTGESHYYLEVQCVDYYRMLDESSNTPLFDKRWIERQAKDQKEVNDKIIDLAEEVDIPVVATTDAHYVGKTDREAHLLLLAIQSKKTIETPADGPGGRLAFEATSMLSADELMSSFTETESGFNGYPEYLVEEWMQNSVNAANAVSYPAYLKPRGYQLPEFPIEETDDFGEFLNWKEKLDQSEVESIIYEQKEPLKEKIIND